MTRRRSRAGLAIVTFSLVSAVIIPLLGLGLDAAMLCVVKERLSSAVESAAHAAARYPEKDPRIDPAVRRFLDANFPEGHMGIGSRTVLVEGGRILVKVDAPTYFMKLLHVRSVEVAAVAQVTRQP